MTKLGELCNFKSGNHAVAVYEMSGKPYSQKSGCINHSYERIFQVMTTSIRHTYNINVCYLQLKEYENCWVGSLEVCIKMHMERFSHIIFSFGGISTHISKGHEK